jgi:hypothetical protein
MVDLAGVGLGIRRDFIDEFLSAEKSGLYRDCT